MELHSKPKRVWVKVKFCVHHSRLFHPHIWRHTPLGPRWRKSWKWGNAVPKRENLEKGKTRRTMLLLFLQAGRDGGKRERQCLRGLGMGAWVNHLCHWWMEDGEDGGQWYGKERRLIVGGIRGESGKQGGQSDVRGVHNLGVYQLGHECLRKSWGKLHASYINFSFDSNRCP